MRLSNWDVGKLLCLGMVIGNLANDLVTQTPLPAVVKLVLTIVFALLLVTCTIGAAVSETKDKPATVAQADPPYRPNIWMYDEGEIGPVRVWVFNNIYYDQRTTFIPSGDSPEAPPAAQWVSAHGYQITK